MTANYVDATGLHTQTLTEIVTEISDGFKAIYGPDITVDGNSPDGQMINLFAQAKIDTLDCVRQVYNSFNPTVAIGAVLDQRCAINGIIRKGATFTTTNIVVTTDRVLNLIGFSSLSGTPFTVSDGQGNEFLLIDNVTTVNGANTLLFQSSIAGAVQTIINTITNIVTVTLGVISVNNPNSAVVNGTDEETDQALRYRRSISVSLPAQGYLDGLTGGLLGLAGVITVKVYENDGSAFDIYGTPGHSIWCVVDGGIDADIANVIYEKRNAGCGMRGAVIVPVIQPSGFNLQVKFDRPTYEDLYISMTLTRLDPLKSVDVAALKQKIYDTIVFDINQPADYTAITTIVKEADPNIVVTLGGVSSDNITFVPFLYPTTIAHKFINSIAHMSITVV